MYRLKFSVLFGKKKEPRYLTEVEKGGLTMQLSALNAEGILAAESAVPS